MNTDRIQGEWADIKGKIKAKWAKFNAKEVEALKGNLDQLAGKIQKVYGYAKEQAEKEFNDLKATFRSKGSK